jgi:glyoxylase-like metal-dependent hydrolase (beta-lactamase superfamily II)
VTGRPDPITGAMGPWFGGVVSDRARCVLAPNAGPMTLDGTNTWLLAEPGSTAAVVVDPGPDDEVHLRSVVSLAAESNTGIATILLTHGHPDHAQGARALSVLTGAPVRALDPLHRIDDEGLNDGDVVDVDGLVLRIIATPGHTSDSLSFLLEAEGALLTGDTVLGRGTTVVMHPDGRIGDYLHSLNRLRNMADSEHELTTVLPGHGPVLDNPLRVLEAYLEHRHARLDAVAVVLDELNAAHITDFDELVTGIVQRVYADVPRDVWPAAALSVAAQLDFLQRS